MKIDRYENVEIKKHKVFYLLNYLLTLNVLDFGLHQGMWVIKWNKKNEKVLKHSISIGSILFQMCVV